MAEDIATKLLNFIGTSPTPYHCVATLRGELGAAGYTELKEEDSWSPGPGAKHFVVRDGSLMAFQLGSGGLETGFRMIGAHTDSPCLKVKPNPSLNRNGYWQLGVEVYGGVLLGPWFDRDLSLAGRIVVRTSDGNLSQKLVDWKRPIATVPSLAIHLDREVNESRSINKQKEMAPVLMRVKGEKDFGKWVASQGDLGEGEKVLDFELWFYDTQPPALIGVEGDFVASARLDNQLSCFAGLEALKAAHKGTNALLICNDHEEVGSQSRTGADGAFLEQVLERLLPDPQRRAQSMHRSLLISCDNAHGVHPNFPERHDGNHGPLLNGGPVIKVNANQRYATTGETASVVRLLCERAEVPCQAFVVRSDMACGSTIGPLTSARIGVRTVDVGVPTFGMHSIRELGGAKDVGYLTSMLTEFVSDSSW